MTKKPHKPLSRIGLVGVLAAALAGGLGLAACGSSSTGASGNAATTTTTPSTTASAPPTSATTTTGATTTTPSTKNLSPAAKLILKLLKAPPQTALPPSLRGSQTQATPLSAGSRKHHAAGAIVTTNGGALVGYLVFKKHADALADLKAYPPDSGPNKIVSRSVAGLPAPTYVLRANGNGYLARYIVFVDGPVVVNTWAYGQKSKEAALKAVVLANAHWARSHLAAARKAAG
jgi:hypothetical protein